MLSRQDSLFMFQRNYAFVGRSTFTKPKIPKFFCYRSLAQLLSTDLSLLLLLLAGKNILFTQYIFSMVKSDEQLKLYKNDTGNDEPLKNSKPKSKIRIYRIQMPYSDMLDNFTYGRQSRIGFGPSTCMTKPTCHRSRREEGGNESSQEWSDGSVYSGEYKDGHRHGHGEARWPNGEVITSS